MFEGHTDVVTEGDPDLWSVDPFGGEIVDGRLHGRGSADMKSGVAAMLLRRPGGRNSAGSPAGSSSPRWPTRRA